MGHDIRKTTDHREGPKTGSGGGAAYKTGYGAGGLGSGADRADGDEPRAWDAPGVTPGGRRTGTAEDGPRIPMDGESEPEADQD